ncbi:FUSC family protein [Paraphotobacterium marinum]|uniref:FUSC family protein n=1 Tax=Paraphotobacterium marinum TaxID=1755811 RepID=A0A220VH85_9GAMM|nr:FUSC family protein [Paraphotobacterium marinum]ASK79616.1 FUSC family protein [Paraphotobacterium marinum]
MNNSFINRLTKLIYKNHRYLHAFKTSLACLIGLLAYRLFSVEHGQWIIITIAVVMGSQITVGSGEEKSIARTFATIIGALAGGLFLLCGFVGQIYYELLALFIVSLGFAYLAGSKKYSYVGILGTATFVIVGLSHSFHSGVSDGMMRALDILLGVIISIVINRLVFPIYARKELLASMAGTIDKFRLLILDCFSLNRSFTQLESSKYEIQQTSGISSSFLKQSKLLNESDSYLEKIHFKLNLKEAEELILNSKKVFRQTLAMRYTLSLSEKSSIWLKSLNEVKLFLEHVNLFFEYCSHKLLTYPYDDRSFILQDKTLKDLLEVIEVEIKIKKENEHIHLYAFIHSLKYFWKEIKILDTNIKKLTIIKN